MADSSTLVGVLALAIVSASPAPALERLDSLAEDLFDQARAGDWTRAQKSFERLQQECAQPSSSPMCREAAGTKALADLEASLRARQPQQVMRSANRFTELLVPAIDKASGSNGVAALDPAVRQLIIDAHDAAATHQDIQNLSTLTDQLRCTPKSVERFRKRLAEVQRAAAAGDVAPDRLRALDEGVDELEAACAPKTGVR
ncbi:MAG: hypothetical protein JST54_00105 [Deltaproteobacteria bacterium]|nr:hypothetical protein [Deltaproteobacteria bacterium]